ncbi:UDP-N-acetylmuramate--L-alanine ligase [Bifidobacterium gallicum]|uniref:UDP-N-acetylmuramate--L-alanine ligase n=1 Tax=Bifidobacterium gallicum DSM 20093 = LMG 11596 TaxID=561180 RepID=D1NSX3_9BIFI|nr:UDP-N-acetylmuramate--L-alanine ligase [Bifidobacterium gallicum]EFA23775.1 UDP-N-acetylmuramate--L-alanine ligase [Bifidobacterium gallicum DSM 20093 = LMG 11596]KFI59213.1 UDP-N-acetylmuramate--alanine ligase [Bifidobacterium gallicum DSM 20093 = LMG 11596]
MDEEQHMIEVHLDPTANAFGIGGGEANASRTLGRTHFIGIGGAGMSVLAEMLQQRQGEVQGSDRAVSAKTERLTNQGVDVRIGQQASNISHVTTVVYSSAIKPDNPEIQEAARQGLAIVHRSDILAWLMDGKRAVTVAGAHGKSTTSALLAHILVTAGQGDLADPSYAIGASIQGPDGTTRDGGHTGTGDVLVAEADESDGSFAKYHPTIAIITNAEPDHLDHYGTADRYHAAFVNHASHATQSVILCVDDPGARSVLQGMDALTASRTITYGTTAREELGDLNGATFVSISDEQETAGDGSERFVIDMPARVAHAATVVPVTLSIPGIHNARNATAAIIAATLLGMDPFVAAQAATSFHGAARRFDIKGTVNGVTVVDDYAHHPTEIAALLTAARRRYPKARLHVLFQPHLFSRTQFFAQEFAQALALADDVIVTGIFPARERQEDFANVTAHTIVEQAEGITDHAQPWISDMDDMQEAAAAVVERVQPGDVVLTVGAGDITTVTAQLLDLLGDHAPREA